MNYPKLMISDHGDGDILVVLFLSDRKGISLYHPKIPHQDHYVEDYCMSCFNDFNAEIVLTNS